MTTAQKTHLTALVAAYVSADRRNDAAARNRAKAEAVVTYAYVTAKKFDRMVLVAVAA